MSNQMINLDNSIDLAPKMHFCEYTQREDLSVCARSRAQENGKYLFCPVTSWDEYCSKCLLGNQNIGICGFGQSFQKNISTRFEEKTEYLIQCKTQKQLMQIVPLINPNAESIDFGWGQIEDFSFLENFGKLKYIAFNSSRVHNIQWDVSKTPRLEQLVVMGRQLSDLSQLRHALNLRSFRFLIETSRMDRQNITSLEPISQLPNLEEVEIQGARLVDENIEHLITIPKLKKLFVSPDMYNMESFAKFEAEKFIINEEYGVYCNKENDDCVWGYGNDLTRLRIPKKNPEKIRSYLTQYYDLMNKYKK